MPNWCEGCLKIRGTTPELRNFLVNAVKPVNFLGDDQLPLRVMLSPDGTELEVRTPDGNLDLSKTTLWLKGTRRHFIEPNYIDVYAADDETPVVIHSPFKAAWAIDTEPLRKLSQEYHVDLKVLGIERGMQFCQDVEILNGEISKNEEIEYGDWDWDCPFPTMGG
jgi:hypothetical protein